MATVAQINTKVDGSIAASEAGECATAIVRLREVLLLLSTPMSVPRPRLPLATTAPGEIRQSLGPVDGGLLDEGPLAEGVADVEETTRNRCAGPISPFDVYIQWGMHQADCQVFKIKSIRGISIATEFNV